MKRLNLPGDPPQRLIRDVRRALWTYLRSRPQERDQCWVLAWEWARHIAETSAVNALLIRKRKQWPSATEISSSYLLLVLGTMKGDCRIRLTESYVTRMPASVEAYIAEQQQNIALQGYTTGLNPLVITAQ